MLEVQILYSTQPDWMLPARGDSGHNTDGTDYLLRMVGYYKCKDFKWAGTKGKECTIPVAKSYRNRPAGPARRQVEYGDDLFTVVLPPVDGYDAVRVEFAESPSIRQEYAYRQRTTIAEENPLCRVRV